MHHYENVQTRFLRHDERLILSEEQEMPLVIEAKDHKDISFLQQFLKQYTAEINEDLARYGAVLFRGFEVSSDQDFENTVLAIQNFRGISEAFMSEEGRIQVENLKYVLHTNAVYKTGGTLYLGGFHTENYYSADVPATICFCCLQPSQQGGETGLINMEKIYESMDPLLKTRLSKNAFFVAKWLISEVATRYQITTEQVEKIAEQCQLPILGNGSNRFILMYKPSILTHPKTHKNALQINLFELAKLNSELRKCFEHDYHGHAWFWHRFIWKLPPFILKTLEIIYISCASFFYSPKAAIKILLTKFKTAYAMHKLKLLPSLSLERVGSCFSEQDIKQLAREIRRYYCSCLWHKGDILLVDNRKVAHAGMPGTGPRLVRAMIGNPLEMPYAQDAAGMILANDRASETVGALMADKSL